MKFIIQHQTSTAYYSKKNEQIELTNKVFKVVLTKNINAKKIDWDTKLYLAL